MAKHYRRDKTCLNCGYTVDRLYCSNCGQENLEPEPDFIHLITDFFSDSFHYDSKFSLSFNYLFTRPGELTRLFIDGKRDSYIHPFRLFFFLSLLLVFILEIPYSGKISFSSADNERQNSFAAKVYKSWNVDALPTTVEELEASQKASGEVIGPLKHKFNVQLIKLKQLGEGRYFEKHHEAQLQIMPKFYILMMPFIAFFLWIALVGTGFKFETHLIFSFHFVSFFIIFAASYQLLARIASYAGPGIFSHFPKENLSFSVIFSIALFYLLFAMKRCYALNWLRTIISTVIVFSMIVGLFLFAGYVVVYDCLLNL